MDEDITLGVLVPTGRAQWGTGTDPRELIDFGVRVERLGFGSVFVNDSLISPRIEALTMLSALAGVTRRVRLGTGALLPFLRRPVQAAQALASIDLLSAGRLTVAVGAGFPGRFGRPFNTLSDVPWERRFARLDDTVALWRHLWTADGSTSFHGQILHLDNIPTATLPFRAGGPPIWLAGATPAALARAGRLYDGWLPYPPDPAEYRSGLHQVRTAAMGAGRDADQVTPALFITVRIDADIATGREVLERYARVNYGMSLHELEAIQAVVTGTHEQVAERLRDYVAAGARHLVIRIGALDLASQRDQLQKLTELPTLSSRPKAAAASPPP
jgi:alkanesulfonate monooxygenase SsuD/methylene tetrahydromethanopterin reductase-like flavin-dependent oxidoreductase (luciferase family)